MAEACKPPRRDDVANLLEHVRDHDVPCPLCGYNLRNLTRPQCPECREELVLSVGLLRPRFGWLLVTVTPGMFSGIAAGLLAVPIAIASLHSSPPPWPLYATDAFGWTSGIAALLLFRYRHAFLRQPRRRQILWALTAWAIHVLAFAALVATAALGTWQ